MAISPLAAARTACVEAGWQLTNLHIQKLLFFAQKAFLGRTRTPLVTQNFQAWDLGPVVPELYFELRRFGDDYITRLTEEDNREGLQERNTVREIVEHFRGVSAGTLVALSHRPGGAWATNYRPGVRSIVIPNADILREYNQENGL